ERFSAISWSIVAARVGAADTRRCAGSLCRCHHAAAPGQLARDRRVDRGGVRGIGDVLGAGPTKARCSCFERRSSTMKWITRERARVDRIACPWLISRFIDKEATFLFVPADQVMSAAQREGATPYDVPAVELGHHGDHC